MESEKENINDEESIVMAKPKQKKLGGIKTMPFILGMYLCSILKSDHITHV